MVPLSTPSTNAVFSTSNVACLTKVCAYVYVRLRVRVNVCHHIFECACYEALVQLVRTYTRAHMYNNMHICKYDTHKHQSLAPLV